jgi:DNA-binding YbaB/EbfC family protein
MKNIGQMLKQAQQIQTRMAEAQEALKTLEVTGQSGAGMCTVTLNGKGDLRGLKIDKSLVDPEDVEVLEDLIVAAFNDAKAKADEVSKEKMSEVTGGLKLPPGLNLPF